MSDVRTLLKKRPLLFDGGMGTYYKGAPGRECEQANRLDPEGIRAVHRAYLAVGADAIKTNTFGLPRMAAAQDPEWEALADAGWKLAAEAAAGTDAAVFADLGPAPDTEGLSAAQVYTAVVRRFAALGAKNYLFETLSSDTGVLDAVRALRETVPDAFVQVSFAVLPDGYTREGQHCRALVRRMADSGLVDAVGLNCVSAPGAMRTLVQQLGSVGIPLSVMPNAGYPVVTRTQVQYRGKPDYFASELARLAAEGVRILGGCCGTTPQHLAALSRTLRGMECALPETPRRDGICLTSRSQLVRIGVDEPLVVIGERINPTGKKALTQELQEGRFDTALQLADQQVEAGAGVLDVNVGASLVDETVLLPDLVQRLAGRLTLPLSLDSSNAEAIAKALPYCPGSFLVNSISGEADRMDVLGPLCRDYGAPFILLPLQGAKLPVRAAERIRIVEHLLERAAALGIPRRLVMVDILALAVSSKAEGGRQCLQMARWCRSQGLPTTLGLSNISFGLPARELLNATFLSMAVGAGLTSCIANPSATRLREAVDAMRVLGAHDPHAESFIASYAEWKPAGGAVLRRNGGGGAAKTLGEAVLNGDKENVLPLLDAELEAGADPFVLVQDTLIPAITEVGARYERREYFLPQLIRAAETMQTAFAHLKPRLEANRGQKERPVIVMATVEGDIHDIGKNIVALLLGNHGFDVVDAGKDVPAEAIVACALEHNARIIGLSALMTTTMVRMEDTIRLIRERDLPIKVMVGGAAVTQAFADAIGADAYCPDAVCAVRAAKNFV